MILIDRHGVRSDCTGDGWMVGVWLVLVLSYCRALVLITPPHRTQQTKILKSVTKYEKKKIFGGKHVVNGTLQIIIKRAFSLLSTYLLPVS